MSQGQERMPPLAIDAETFYALALLESPDCLSVSLLADGTYILVNQVFYQVTGFSPEEVIGHNSIELNIWVDDAGRKVLLDALQREGVVRGLDLPLRIRNGRVKRFQLSAAIVKIKDKDCIITSMRDVSERDELLEREERLRFQLERAEEVADIGSWEFDFSTGKVTASPGAYRIYGVDGSDLSIKYFEEVPLPEYRSLLDNSRDNLIQRSIPYDIEFKIARHNDGVVRDIHSKALYDADSRKFYGIIRDVTEEKKAGEAIRELNLGLEAKVAERTEALRQSNRELSMALEEVQRTQDELLKSERLAALGQLAAGMAHELNTPLAAILSALSTVKDSLGTGFVQLVSILRNLPEDKFKLFCQLIVQALEHEAHPELPLQCDRQRSIAAKLAPLGEKLAWELAEVLETYDLDYLAESLPAAGDSLDPRLLALAGEWIMAPRMASVMEGAARQASEVVRALRQYLKPSSATVLESVDVEKDIEAILTMLHDKTRLVSIERHYQGLRVWASSSSLNQVWMNIIGNALQAMEYRGSLTISTELQGRMALVTFTDTGKGIPDDVKPRIFEAFFTTKKNGEGLGLGLDICRRVVRDLKGDITFTSEAGRTSFMVLLPVGEDGQA